jgi:hypothetical protein
MKLGRTTVVSIFVALALTACGSSETTPELSSTPKIANSVTPVKAVDQQVAQSGNTLGALDVVCPQVVSPGGNQNAVPPEQPCGRNTPPKPVVSEIIVDYLDYSTPATLALEQKVRDAFGFGFSQLDQIKSRIYQTHIDAWTSIKDVSGDKYHPPVNTYTAYLRFRGQEEKYAVFTGDFEIYLSKEGNNLTKFLNVADLTIFQQSTLPKTGRLRTIFSEPDKDRVSVTVNYASREDLVLYSLDNSISSIRNYGFFSPSIGTLAAGQPYMASIEKDSSRYDLTIGQLTAQGIVVNPASGGCIGPVQPGHNPNFCTPAPATPVAPNPAPAPNKPACEPLPSDLSTAAYSKSAEVGVAVGGAAAATRAVAKAQKDLFTARNPKDLAVKAAALVVEKALVVYATSETARTTKELEGINGQIRSWYSSHPNHC